MLPSSSDLTYFLEVAQAGNLTHAAERLGISQPSLTLAMQRLESSVGAALLIRSRQGVKLTKAGEKVLLETRQLIAFWEELRGGAVDAMNEVKGRFILGCHPSVAIYSLPLFLPSLLNAHPGLEIGLHHDLSRHITRGVLDMVLDFGIVINPTPHPDLVMKLLGKDIVTLWKTKSLKNPDVLICDPSLNQSQKILQTMKKQGHEFTRVIESSNLEVITRLADCGAGVGLLPTRVVEAQNTSLVKVKDAPERLDEIYLIYRVENKKVRVIQKLSETIQAGFA